MRKITKEAVDAFYNREKYNKDNTRVDVTNTNLGNIEVYMSLYGNDIAYIQDNILYIRNAGWKTKTTKERLNGLRGVSIVQKKGEWYLDGELWDGEWVAVK